MTFGQAVYLRRLFAQIGLCLTDPGQRYFWQTWYLPDGKADQVIQLHPMPDMQSVLQVQAG